MMSTVKTCLFLTIAVIVVSNVGCNGILGHSGIVFHVDKHGHWSGHSSHYDYRYYPEKSLLGYLMDHHHHNMIDDHHHLGNDAYDHINDHSYHGSHDPYFFFAGNHHSYH